jgi:hypothetical protein
MTYLLANAPLKLREITPVDFVPMAALLVLLIEREILRTRSGARRTVVHHVMGLAIVPLVALFLLFIGLRALTMLG